MGLAVLGVGCAEPSTEDLCAALVDEEPLCVLGTGSVLFEDLEDGDDLPVHQGPQGGFHVTGSLRGEGLHPGTWEDFTDPNNPRVTFSLTTDEGQLGGYSDLPRPLKERSDGWLELVGEFVTLDIASVGEATYLNAVLSVEVTDACGTTVSDDREVLLVPGT